VIEDAPSQPETKQKSGSMSESANRTARRNWSWQHTAAVICATIVGGVPLAFLIYLVGGMVLGGVLILGSFTLVNYVLWYPVWRRLQQDVERDVALPV
jgi:hypothetical protein